MEGGVPSLSRLVLFLLSGVSVIMKIKSKLVGGFVLAVTVPAALLLMLNITNMAGAIRGTYEEKVRTSVVSATQRSFPGMVSTVANYISFLAADANLVKSAYYALEIGSLENVSTFIKAQNSASHLSRDS